MSGSWPPRVDTIAAMLETAAMPVPAAQPDAAQPDAVQDKPRPVNRHGRKPGRGLRPWLLMGKLISVAIYFGSLVTTAVIWFAGVLRDGEAVTDTGLAQVAALTGALFRAVVIPSLVLTLGFGILLTADEPRIMLRQRWLQVKLLLLMLAMPVSHLAMAGSLHRVTAAAAAGQSDLVAERLFSAGFVVVILGSIGVMALGRIKPRLGQNWAKAYRAATARRAARSADAEEGAAP